MAKRHLARALVHMMRRNAATVIGESQKTFIIDSASAFPSIHAWPTQYITFQPIRCCQCLRPCLPRREPARSSRFLQGERQQGAYLRRRIPIKAQVEHRYREPSQGRRATQTKPLAAQTETTRFPRSAPHQPVPTMESRDLMPLRFNSNDSCTISEQRHSWTSGIAGARVHDTVQRCSILLVMEGHPTIFGHHLGRNVLYVDSIIARDRSGQALYQLAEELRIMPIPRLGVGY